MLNFAVFMVSMVLVMFVLLPKDAGKLFATIVKSYNKEMDK